MEAKIRDELKSAQLMGNETVVQALRLLLSEMRNAQIQKGSPLTDDEIVTVIQKEIKKRKEASHMFRTGYREELAEKEDAEAAVLQTYLPEQLPAEELWKIVENAIQELGAHGPSDMGKVIGAVRSQVGQKADGATISGMVKEALNRN